MYDLTSNISAIKDPVSLVALSASKESAASSLKINGLSCLFIPSEKLSDQVYSFPIQEEQPVEELELLESLDSDEESVESLEEEKEEFEEASCSENKTESLDGDFLGEDSREENFFEMIPEKISIDERFKRMWQRNETAFLEIFGREHKIGFTISALANSSFRFPLLF